MPPLAKLAALTGEWTATYKLFLEPPTSFESATSATVTSVLDGRFVRIDYTWSHDGNTNAGSLLVGHEKATGIATIVWIDNWHNSDKMLISTGKVDEGGAVDVRGSYPAPTGPDWGWRTRLETTDTGWAMLMFNITPDGEEYPAVDARYRSSSQSSSR